MDDVYTRRDPTRTPVHPGEILRGDVLPGLSLPVSQAAQHLGVTRQALHRVLSGRAAISPEMAVRIGKLCGNGPLVWLHLQVAYDLWHAERSVDVESIPTLRVGRCAIGPSPPHPAIRLKSTPF